MIWHCIGNLETGIILVRMIRNFNVESREVLIRCGMMSWCTSRGRRRGKKTVGCEAESEREGEREKMVGLGARFLACRAYRKLLLSTVFEKQTPGGHLYEAILKEDKGKVLILSYAWICQVQDLNT